ncbi:MAG: transposase [Blastocatellia bacterium]|nr:transposase [Blastocatellia bacterium]
MSDKPWPHAPIHLLDSNAVFMMTAGTLHKEHVFGTNEKLTLLENRLLAFAQQYGWQLEAWAVFSNHYHFIARSQNASSSLGKMIRHLHAATAREVNKLDKAEGRQVWFNFWDTKLTFQKSYLARLNYVHQNPVKHGLVQMANQYDWCSAAWFERVASAATINTVYGMKTDGVSVVDDF